MKMSKGVWVYTMPEDCLGIEDVTLFHDGEIVKLDVADKDSLFSAVEASEGKRGRPEFVAFYQHKVRKKNAEWRVAFYPRPDQHYEVSIRYFTAMAKK